MEARKLIICLCIFIVHCRADDMISGNQTIIDNGNSTIDSASGLFELGFFSPGKSKNRYLGIWYKSISAGTVVWVANRESPLMDDSGVLRIDENGRLVLSNGAGAVIWSSKSSRAAKNAVCLLLDSGNLVIRYEDDPGLKRFLWQSFDHPGDQFLPGMKLGWDLGSGLNQSYLTSWRSSDDPSPGDFTLRLNLDGFPQVLVWNGAVVQFRFGPWDGVGFSGTSPAIKYPRFISNFTFQQTGIYYGFHAANSSDIMRVILNPEGNVFVLVWINKTRSWESLLTSPKDDCDRYAFCGPFGVCNIAKARIGSSVCGCVEGFEPKFPEKWKEGDWSDGCVRINALSCGHGDRFILYPGQKLPDTRRSWFNQSTILEDCKIKCLSNCSCTAYSKLDVREGRRGCMLWFDDISDLRDNSEDVQNLYVRLATSKSAENRSSRKKRKLVIIVIVVSFILTILLCIFTRYILKKRKLRREGFKLNLRSDPKSYNNGEDLDLPLFGFSVIANATDCFSENSKLGEGGFGCVYKGILKDGQEIAVKRLAKESRQRLREFKNEISCIAKLQHRNLVRLLGFCIEREEMLLIYEYMPNNSLNHLLFESERRRSLDWPKRYNIINGIARGLLYLHQDSRLKVIHRDMKASNVLIDSEMNPRISDFGLARIFWGSESESKTTKVVGTYGYMSPEYALDGKFSDKSDVYSFGVLVLEIVSGIKMGGFFDLDPDLNLLRHAWTLYQEGKCLELLDQAAMDSYNQSELFRVIQVGLLCVQPYPEDRPSMSMVLLMLSSHNELARPKQPTFFNDRNQLVRNQLVSESSLISEISSSSSIFSPR
ncbi:hypothetical protein DCAR_0205356 [Daucus carota subsp. sativus]|uniref:Receptor-like serine/threonine-protein kinase n=2 Tax=Daucus carota subsp. sativus TaxID=79200 RepID=A0AAF0WDQ9_DAUCS|nr:hypothetical protein DCAR_0205356 [Daucus carota subsp. sativus]